MYGKTIWDNEIRGDSRQWARSEDIVGVRFRRTIVSSAAVTIAVGTLQPVCVANVVDTPDGGIFLVGFVCHFRAFPFQWCEFCHRTFALHFFATRL